MDPARSKLAEALERPPLYDRIDARQLAVLKESVAKGATDAELAAFLELADSLDLNPFAHEIWCAKGRGRDGGPGRLLVMVGRDGLLKNANRYGDYLGFDADVVHASDDFRRDVPDADSKTLRGRAGIVHTYGHPAERGEVIGAWCVAERAGRPPRYFYAAMAEYAPGNADARSPWAKQPSVMIDKVALSVVHRTLCGITGVLVEEEAARILEDDAVVPSDPFPPGLLGDEMREAVATIHAAHPDRYPPAVLQMMLGAQNVESLQVLAERFNEEAVAAAGSLLAREEAQEAAELGDAVITADAPLSDVDWLRSKLAELRGLRAKAEEGSNAAGALDAEIAKVEDSLRAAGESTADANADGEMLNVKDYGAVGDGVTDDTTARQAAVDAAEADAADAEPPAAEDVPAEGETP